MKICLVSDNLVGYHQTWSGAELVCQYLTSLLKKKGHKVFFITLKSSKKDTPEDIFPAPACTAKIWFFKTLIPLHLVLRTIYSFFYLRKLKPDVIHLLRSNSLFVPVMISARLLNIPTTFTVLDYFIICPKSNLLLKNGKICKKTEGWHCLKCVSVFRLFERMIIKSLAKSFKKIITFTQTSKSRLISHGFSRDKIKVKYIYNFYSAIPRETNNQLSRTKDTILFVGSFNEHKGLDILIRALPQIIFKIPNSKLTVVGKGNELDTLRIKKLTKELKMSEHIKFLGQKKNEETLRIISESEVIVVPEQWLSDFGPIILVEAMSLGKPIVASRIGATSEFIKDGFSGFLVERNNSEEFAEKIIWLLKNKETAQQMGDRAKKSFQVLFNSDQEKEIIKLYTNL